MTLAYKVKTLIESQCPNTFSLYAGYGMKAGQYVRFPQGTLLLDKRNDKGRCIKTTYKYADDSKLTYKFNQSNNSYSLTIED